MELICRIGHRYSLSSLLEVKNSALEGALWAAVRALEEQVSLRRRLAELPGAGEKTAAQFQAAADDAERQVRLVRGLLEERG